MSTALAEIPANATFTDALPYMNGFVVVLITLTVLWMLASALRYLPHGRPAAAVAPPHETAASTPVRETASGISPEVVAVISAAVHIAAGGTQRVVSIRQGQSEWNRFGRQRIFSSHTLK